MDAVTERIIHAGQGTPEALWLASEQLRDVAQTTLQALVPAGSRAVVVAPHPDDEVLLAGGLIQQLVRHQRSLVVVAVTNGGASHPASTHWPAPLLGLARAREQTAALRSLGAGHAPIHRLGLPDGGLQSRRAALVESLLSLLMPSDVVFATWRLDGHPDHEAVGEASASAAAHCGAHLVEVPVWGWHWSHPGDTPIPWGRARRLPVSAADVQSKLRALQSHQTQLQPDPSTGAAPILDAASQGRATRPFELFLV